MAAAPGAAAPVTDDTRTVLGRLFQLAWHPDDVTGRNAPLYSIDAHPSLPIIAVCSADRTFSLWRYKAGSPPSSTAGGAGAAPIATPHGLVTRVPEVDVEFMYRVDGHEAPVNALRFSPNGARRRPRPALTAGAAASSLCYARFVALVPSLQARLWRARATVRGADRGPTRASRPPTRASVPHPIVRRADKAALVWRPKPGFTWETAAERRDLTYNVCR
jgi:hypothetical protein